MKVALIGEYSGQVYSVIVLGKKVVEGDQVGLPSLSPVRVSGELECEGLYHWS